MNIDWECGEYSLIDIDGDLLGSLNLGQASSNWVNCGINIDGSASGPITIGGEMQSGSSITIDGNCSGGIDIGSFLAGPVTIGGDLSADLTVDGYVSGNILIGGMFTEDAKITTNGALSGDLDVNGTGQHEGHVKVIGTCSGDITINEDYAGKLIVDYLTGSVTINDDLNFVWIDPNDTDPNIPEGWGSVEVLYNSSGPIEVGKDVRGTIMIYNNGTSDIDIGGDVYNAVVIYDTYASDTIHIGGDLLGAFRVGYLSSHHMYASLAIDGDMDGSIHVWGNLYGEIQINGSLRDDPNMDYDIKVDGVMGSAAAITVDWDGYPFTDSWDPNSNVNVDDTIYNGNSPGADDYIWNTTCQKGDLNNDGSVNSLDTDPFVSVLTYGYGPGSDYDEDFPGLRGSAWYHAEMDCNDPINSLDIDAFALRLTDPNSYYSTYSCEQCGRGGGGGEAVWGDTPAEVAEMLEQYVAEERMSDLLEIIKELVDYFGDSARGKFWAAVLKELE